MRMYFLLAILLFSLEPNTKANANTAYELPRSSVIELQEATTGRTYPIFIQTPVSYEYNPEKIYPVIYLTDANYTFPIASGATRFPMNSGVMQQVIIVAISYASGSRGQSSRIRDFTPSKALDWKYETGKAKQHLAFIKDKVLPYVEQNYRASKTKRTFVGNSLGGLFGAYILFSEPELFSSYILGSPSVWFKNESILDINPIETKKNLKVYISVGELETPAHQEKHDMVSGAVKLKNKIENFNHLNIETRLSVINGASHATAFPTTVIQGLDWIYGIKK